MSQGFSSTFAGSSLKKGGLFKDMMVQNDEKVGQELLDSS